MIESGLKTYEDEVFVTDRNGESMVSIGDALIEVNPDWDIDRPGSKGAVEITAHRGVLEPGMWIAPFRTIYPEVGEVKRYQLGHFRIGRPSHSFDGSYGIDTGEPSYLQVARGSDIVDVIANSVVRETFYTPLRGNIMQDVMVAAQMATCGIMGPNLVTNGSFEDGNSSWTNWGGATLLNFVPPEDFSWGWLPADGTHAAANLVSSATALNTVAGFFQDVPVPAGTQYMYASAIVEGGMIGLQAEFVPEWRNNGIWMADMVIPWVGGTGWNRLFTVLPVPAGATHFRLACNHRKTVAAGGGDVYIRWDDIRCGTCTRMPIPKSRLKFPNVTIEATKRIQTIRGRSWGYDAINGDRLAAIEYRAMFTEQDGALTSMPFRSIGDTQPKRVYGAGSFGLTSDPVEVDDDNKPIPNHFTAVKEDWEDAANSWFAEAFNNNPNDRFSTVHSEIVTADPPIQIPDAVSQAALQAAADAARDNNTAREAMSFSVFLDPDLNVYDVVEFTDPDMPAVLGRWLVENISYDGPKMIVRCRRTLGGN